MNNWLRIWEELSKSRLYAFRDSFITNLDLIDLTGKVN